MDLVGVLLPRLWFNPCESVALQPIGFQGQLFGGSEQLGVRKPHGMAHSSLGGRARLQCSVLEYMDDLDAAGSERSDSPLDPRCSALRA